jgi:hypothetical protein
MQLEFKITMQLIALKEILSKGEESFPFHLGIWMGGQLRQGDFDCVTGDFNNFRYAKTDQGTELPLFPILYDAWSKEIDSFTKVMIGGVPHMVTVTLLKINGDWTGTTVETIVELFPNP